MLFPFHRTTVPAIVCVSLLIALLGLPPKAGADANVTGERHTGSVAGNGSLLTDSIDVLRSPPQDRTVKIHGKGYVPHGSAFGSFSFGDENITSNTVNVYDGGRVKNMVHGGYSRNGGGLVRNNMVNVYDNGWVGGNVYGGCDGGDNFSGGELAINPAYCGDANKFPTTGSTLDNLVEIYQGGTVDGDVYGGYGHGVVQDNTVKIHSGGVVKGDVYGGYLGKTGKGQVSGNTVHVTDSTVEGSVYGGDSGKSNTPMERNRVKITNSSVGGQVFGDIVGISDSTVGKDVSSPNLTITNSTVGGKISGGVISITGSTLKDSSPSPLVHSGLLTLSNSTIGSYRYLGGDIQFSNNTFKTFWNDKGMTLSLTGNTFDKITNLGTMTLTGSTIGDLTGTLSGTRTTINGGTATGTIRGGYGSQRDEYDGPTVTDNTLTINGGTFKGLIQGGYSYHINEPYYGEFFSPGVAGDVTGNTITISGGMFEKAIYGGFSETYANSHGYGPIKAADTGNVTHNTITISGGTFKDGLYGGGAYTSKSTGGQIRDLFTGNTLNLLAQVAIPSAANFEYINFGYSGDAGIAKLDTTPTGSAQPGVVVNTGTHDVTFSGEISGSGTLTKSGARTLTLSGNNAYTGPTVIESGTLRLAGAGSVSDHLALHRGTTFDTGGKTVSLSRLNVLEPAAWTGDLKMNPGAILDFHLSDSGTMLTVDGTASLDDVIVSISLDGSRRPRLRDSFVLLDATSLSAASGKATARIGALMQYEFDLIQDPGRKLIAEVAKTSVDARGKSLLAGTLAGLALTNSGADLIAGQGMNQAVTAAEGQKTGAFGAFSGGWSRYNSGSHVDISSVSFLAGLSHGANFAPGHLTVGVFFEYGTGSYETHNSFSNGRSVKSKGHVYNMGGGILGRMDFAETGPGNAYAEGSVRVGNLHNGYSNRDLRDDWGRGVDYDYNSMYYGTHLGAGYVWDITDSTSLDLYGKYFWTRLEGDSKELRTGDKLHIKDADSSRLHGGARASHALTPLVGAYVGAAYEYEFDGKGRGTVFGYGLSSPSMKGGTGIGEIGFTVTPATDKPLSFDVGIQGSTGKREGVSGSLQLKFEF